MAKALVVYYSRKGENHMPGGIQVLEKGNTAYAAEYIAKAVDADLFEIDTVVPYAENYRQCCGQAVAEKKENARPAIKGFVEDISGYETVYVCFPNWCGTAPMCVFTFWITMTGQVSVSRPFAPTRAAVLPTPKPTSPPPARVPRFCPVCPSGVIRPRTAQSRLVLGQRA